MPGGPLADQFAPGFPASERSPDALDLYITPEDLENLYGVCVDATDIRGAMAIIHAETNRTSLWPEPYEERLTLVEDFRVSSLAARPVVSLTGVRGRYGARRRDHRAMISSNVDYYAALAVMGSGANWQDIDVTTIDFNPATGELLLPVGFLPLSYTEIQVNYIAGLVHIPDRIKFAIAEIINTIHLKGTSDRTYYSVGKIQTTWAGTGYVSAAAKRLLAPYVVQALY
mgnify:CR=1 FL=1